MPPKMPLTSLPPLLFSHESNLYDTHDIPFIKLIQLSYSIVLHHFFEIDSHIFQEKSDTQSVSTGGRNRSVVKFDPQAGPNSTVLSSLRETVLNFGDGHGTTSTLSYRFDTSENEFLDAGTNVSYLIFSRCLTPSQFIDDLSETSTQTNLALFVTNIGSTTQAQLSYNESIHSHFQANNFARSFNSAMKSVLEKPHQLVSKVDLLSQLDYSMLDIWNSQPPRAEQTCLHQLVEHIIEKYPGKPAIISWDGEVTYQQLDLFASRLATHLISSFGLGPGKKVPICFEKSSWAIVTMLAILKTGAAYCCLDPTHPEARHDFIIKSVDASLIISSPKQKELFRKHPKVLPIDIKFIETLQTTSQKTPSITPDCVALIAFTSGSTGVPKGIVHTHTTMCTGLVENAPRQELNRPDTRVFQWAAYTFDVSLTEIWGPLIHGGCICIPSEEERLNDVEKAMNRMRCEWAFFTPSFSRFFRRYTVPTLKTLAMGGEAAMADDINAWLPQTKVLQVYGPAECITWFLKGFTEPSPKTVSFGKPTNAHLWIVDQENSDRLLPIGAVGELLIEGPALFIEYLNDPGRTESSFINPPLWRKSIGAPCTHRIYKSGDLVQYLPNGEITYVGRKDGMVKLRGQRIDLGEIEYALRVSLGDIADSAVDLITPCGRNQDQYLVAFIHFKTETCSADDISRMAPNIQNQLRRNLPEFMVPRIFYSMESLPYNASLKLDRKELRKFASAMTLDQLLYSKVFVPPTASSSNEVLTPVEFRFRKIWAVLLHLAEERIRLDHNFFALGGSSIAALRLIALARDEGFHITYLDIFKTCSLQELAQTASEVGSRTISIVHPFSLLAQNDRKTVLTEATSQCQVPEADIEDVFPLTPQQQGLWALSLANNGSYVAHFRIQLIEGVDAVRFQNAWQTVANEVAFMRTRIIQTNRGAYQVVLKKAPQWQEARSADEFVDADLCEATDFGEPLTRYAFVRGKLSPLVKSPSNDIVIWRSHHALYDGHSIPMFLNAVAKTYHGENLGPEVPFTSFIRELEDSDKRKYQEYWRSRYCGSKVTNFPQIPFQTYRPNPTGLHTRLIELAQPKDSCITNANILRAALALTIGQISGASNVNFLETLDGRSIPVPQIESIIGPTFATVPRSTTINGAHSIETFLSDTQRTSVEMIPYAQYGLQNIRLLSPECATACEFQTILVIEPTYRLEYTDVFEFDESGGGIQRFNSDCIMWKCNMTDSGVELIASFDEEVISEAQLLSMVDLFTEYIFILCNKDRSTPLSAVAKHPIDIIEPATKQEHRRSAKTKTATKSLLTNGALGKVSELLKQAWIESLDLDALDFNNSQDFFLKGGNSIRAMELVAAARRLGVSMSVSKIFQTPIFKDLTERATLLGTNNPTQTPRFSLLGAVEERGAIIREAVVQCGIGAEDIEEILPATELQKELMASSHKKTGAWMAQTRFTVPDNVSVERFREVWDQLHATYMTFRMRIIHTEIHGTFQVFVKSALPWNTSEKIQEYLVRDRISTMTYGDPLVRGGIFGDTTERTSSQPIVVITMHHSVYDGFTLDKQLQALNALLFGGSLPVAHSFAPFIKYTMSVDKKAEQSFWQTYLAGFSAGKRFPVPPSDTYIPNADKAKKVVIAVPAKTDWPSITFPTIVLAAWGMLISHYTGDEDVVFGMRLSGRNAPVENIMDFLEPTIAHVPVRVKLCRERPIRELLRNLQAEQSEIIAYEQAGLVKIREYNNACRNACSFQNMLVIQRPTDSTPFDIGRRLGLYEELDDYRYFNDFALMLDFFPSTSGIDANLVFSYDSNILRDEQIVEIGSCLESLISSLAFGGEQTVNDISRKHLIPEKVT